AADIATGDANDVTAGKHAVPAIDDLGIGPAGDKCNACTTDDTRIHDDVAAAEQRYPSLPDIDSRVDDDITCHRLQDERQLMEDARRESADHESAVVTIQCSRIKREAGALAKGDGPAPRPWDDRKRSGTRDGSRSAVETNGVGHQRATAGKRERALETQCAGGQVAIECDVAGVRMRAAGGDVVQGNTIAIDHQAGKKMVRADVAADVHRISVDAQGVEPVNSAVDHDLATLEQCVRLQDHITGT